MAYFNNTDDTSLYTTASTFGESDAYLSQTSATEKANDQTSDPFANGWSMGRQPNYMVGSPASLKAEASFGKYDYSPLDDRSLTCTSLQSLRLRRRTTVTTSCHIRNTTGP